MRTSPRDFSDLWVHDNQSQRYYDRWIGYIVMYDWQLIADGKLAKTNKRVKKTTRDW